MKIAWHLVLLTTIFLSCSGEKKLTQIQGETMGTYYKVTLYTDEKESDLKADIDKFLKLYNKVFSTYIKDSEISKLNSSSFDKVKISDSLKKVIELSMDISAKSRGHFDITVGPLVNLWGFGPEGKQKEPSDQQIKAVLKRTGYEKLKLDDNYLNRPQGMYLDLSAIAKGHGVDELVKFLEFRGYSNLIVEIGGELRARGKKADDSNWRIGIEGASEKLGSTIVKVLKLDNLAMATSGSYRNYLKYGDKVFQHTIDPHTGKPVKHETISVSVISEYCADADAWATALMSMGVIEGLKIANELDIMAFFQFKKNEKVEKIGSRKFNKRFGDPKL